MVETQTNKSGNGSKLSGGTRRSRKDRSGIRGTGRQALTPHVYCSLKGQNSLTAMDISPQVRMLPGSDTISLELNVGGLTAPARDLGSQPQIEEEEDSFVPSPKKQLQQSQSFVMPAQRPGMKEHVSPISRNRNQGGLQTAQTQNPVEYRGALNAYVQQTGARSRTPLMTTEAHAQPTEAPSRLADRIMRPVQLRGHQKNVSSTILNSVQQPVTPCKTPDRRLPAPKSAQRTDTTTTVTRTGTLRS